MGKIRIKTIGDEVTELEEQKKLKQKREQKTLREGGRKMTKAPGLKGGEKVVSVGPTEEEIEKVSALKKEKQEVPEKETKKGAKRHLKSKSVSKKYKENKAMLAKQTSYPLKAAIEMIKKFKNAGFNETVELHINVKEKGLNGQIVLPHGTGKSRRIKIADDELINAIEKGKIDFDVLVATPSMMPKLAKVARTLGPRGLMPNPKTGTVSEKPEEVVDKLSKGQVSYKTESQAPIIHMSVGKISFGEKELFDNIKEVTNKLKPANIKSLTLKSTMSPGIKVETKTL